MADSLRIAGSTLGRPLYDSIGSFSSVELENHPNDPTPLLHPLRPRKRQIITVSFIRVTCIADVMRKARGALMVQGGLRLVACYPIK